MSLSKRILGDWYENWYIRNAFELIFIVLPIAFVIRTFGFGLYQVPTGSMETTLLVGERFFADKVTYWFRPPVRGEIIAFNEPTFKYSENIAVNLWQRYVSFGVVNWTKRVIGIPGDHVKGIINTDGKPEVYVNGEKLDESAYINKYPLIRVWRKHPSELGRYRGAMETELRSFVYEVPWGEQPFYRLSSDLIVRNKDGEPAEILAPGTATDFDIFDHKLGENEYWVMGDNRLGSSDSRMFGPLDGSLIHGKIVFRIFSMDTNEAWLPITFIKNPAQFFRDIRWSRCMQFVH